MKRVLKSYCGLIIRTIKYEIKTRIGEKRRILIGLESYSVVKFDFRIHILPKKCA